MRILVPEKIVHPGSVVIYFLVQNFVSIAPEVESGDLTLNFLFASQSSNRDHFSRFQFSELPIATRKLQPARKSKKSQSKSRNAKKAFWRPCQNRIHSRNSQEIATGGLHLNVSTVFSPIPTLNPFPRSNLEGPRGQISQLKMLARHRMISRKTSSRLCAWNGGRGRTQQKR